MDDGRLGTATKPVMGGTGGGIMGGPDSKIGMIEGLFPLMASTAQYIEQNFLGLTNELQTLRNELAEERRQREEVETRFEASPHARGVLGLGTGWRLVWVGGWGAGGAVGVWVSGWVG